MCLWRLLPPQHVKFGVEHGAVGLLMLSDDLFRSTSIAERVKYVDLVSATRAAGGDVMIMSSLHVSGDQLSKLCGVAALLRFPLVIEVEEGEAGEDTSSDTDSDEEEEGEGGVLGRGTLPVGGAGGAT